MRDAEKEERGLWTGPRRSGAYDEYGPALYRFAYRFLQDRGRVEDVVQEVLVKAWRHPEYLDPASGSPRAWLFTVARNILTDEWRADQARALAEGSAAAIADQMRLLEVLHDAVAVLMSSAVGAVHMHETELLAESIVYALTLFGIYWSVVRNRSERA